MDRERLRAFLDDGLSLAEIGRHAGLHPSTVGYWVRKHGLRAVNRERHAGRGALPRDQLAELAAAGETIRGIAAALDRSPTTIRYWLSRYGIATARRRRDPAELPPDRPPRVRLTCPRHGETEFVLRADADSYRCARCRSELVSERRRRVKAMLVEEAGGRCRRCGYEGSAAALHFHHLDRGCKRFALSQEGSARAVERAREEAAKCVLLCANCHAEVEMGAAIVIRRTPDAHGAARDISRG